MKDMACSYNPTAQLMQRGKAAGCIDSQEGLVVVADWVAAGLEGAACITPIDVCYDVDWRKRDRQQASWDRPLCTWPHASSTCHL